MAATFAEPESASNGKFRRGTERVVHVTVGLASGLAPLPTDAALINLRNAMDGMRDGADTLLVQGFSELPFAVTATLRTDPAHAAESVKAVAQAELEAAFGFATMDFAAPVTGAQVIAVLQAVAGVVSVDLDTLSPIDAPTAATTGHSALLRALPARQAAGAMQPAELLLLSPAHVSLTAEPADAR